MNIEGRNPVIESLRAQADLKVVYLQDGINVDEKIAEIIKLIRKQKIPLKYISKKHLQKITRTDNHQGVIALKGKEEEKSIKEIIQSAYDQKKDPYLIYVRDVQYEGNLGAIIRTAEAAGMDGVIIPPKIEITPQTVRAAMGATEHIPVSHIGLFQGIKIAKEMGLQVIGIELTGNDYYFKSNLTLPTLLIIGGEDKSLSEEVADKCDAIVKIPMKGKVNSLNMSVAAAIVIYDRIRQEFIPN